MRTDEKTLAFMTGDGSPRALARRLLYARIASGFAKQVEMADALGVSKTTYGHQEKNGKPSVGTMRFLYINHRIDFNFVLNGDFAQLPGDVQRALEDAHRYCARQTD